MALRLQSCALLAVFLLPLTLSALFASASATASASDCLGAASASTCPGPASASTCPGRQHGQTPEAGMDSPKDSSSAEGTMEEEEERLLGQIERLMREGTAAKDLARRLKHARSVLEFLGFGEMAAAAPYLANSPLLASWPGAITIFAVPDERLQASCSCPSLVKHVALGYFPYSDLVAKPQKKVPAAVVGFCFTSSSSSAGGASSSKPFVSINGVKIVGPDLYNDGRLIVHGVEEPVVLPPQGSCYASSTSLLSRTDLLNLLVGMVANANRRRA